MELSRIQIYFSAHYLSLARFHFSIRIKRCWNRETEIERAWGKGWPVLSVTVILLKCAWLHMRRRRCKQKRHIYRCEKSWNAMNLKFCAHICLYITSTRSNENHMRDGNERKRTDTEPNKYFMATMKKNVGFDHLNVASLQLAQI